MLYRISLTRELLDIYATAYKRIIYILYIFLIYTKLIFIIIKILILLINLELAFII